MAWVLLLATAVAVLVTGLAATILVFGRFGTPAPPTSGRFWVSFMLASALTLASISLRALRFIFLLRRAEARIPIRDAYIGYLAGFALLLAPFFVGEIAVRSWILGRRGNVSAGITAVVNLWERWLDAVAVATIAGVLWLMRGDVWPGALALATAIAFGCLQRVRFTAVQAIVAVVNRVGRIRSMRIVPGLPRLAATRTWAVAFAVSLAGWLLPALGFWLLIVGAEQAVPAPRAILAYSSSTLIAGITLAPGGVVVAGGRLIEELQTAGIDPALSAFVVFAGRMATAGVSTVFGLVFVFLHLRSQLPPAGDHFDAIANAYDVQIPEARRRALVARKTGLMRDCLERHGIGRRGVDVGCGQGWYVGSMREQGFEVTGFDLAAGQVNRAAHHLRDASLVRIGSALAIPVADATVDFAYTINVLHHLPSVEDQRRAFVELLRVIKPGGLVFLHEINTTNVLFRFYMGYIFPSLNCIDEGLERWLLPDRLSTYTDTPVVEIVYFTFFPDFMPESIVTRLAPFERWLERSRLRRYSAHYMAVLRKPA